MTHKLPCASVSIPCVVHKSPPYGDHEGGDKYAQKKALLQPIHSIRNFHGPGDEGCHSTPHEMIIIGGGESLSTLIRVALYPLYSRMRGPTLPRGNCYRRLGNTLPRCNSTPPQSSYLLLCVSIIWKSPQPKKKNSTEVSFFFNLEFGRNSKTPPSVLK